MGDAVYNDAVSKEPGEPGYRYVRKEESSERPLYQSAESAKIVDVNTSPEVQGRHNPAFSSETRQQSPLNPVLPQRLDTGKTKRWYAEFVLQHKIKIATGLGITSLVTLLIVVIVLAVKLSNCSTMPVPLPVESSTSSSVSTDTEVPVSTSSNASTNTEVPLPTISSVSLDEEVSTSTNATDIQADVINQ